MSDLNSSAQWRVLCAAVLSLICASLSAAATDVSVISREIDLLRIPSAVTQHGERKLLLSVAKAGKRLVAVGQGGLIIHSDDEGQSWHQSETPASVLLTSVAFVDEQVGWAVGHDGLILITQDGGSTWEEQFDGAKANEQILAAAQHALNVLKAGSTSGNDQEQRIELAEDRLADAEAAEEAGPSVPLLSVALTNSTTAFAVGAFGYAFETRNGGHTWTYFGDRLGNPEGLHINAVAAFQKGELYLAGEAGHLFHSDDDGQSWRAIDTGYSGPLYGVIGGHDSNVRIAYGFRGHIFRSVDGVNWTAVESPIDKALVSGFSDARGLWLLARDGQLLHSADGGLSFVRRGLLPGALLSQALSLGDKVMTVGALGVQLDELAR